MKMKMMALGMAALLSMTVLAGCGSTETTATGTGTAAAGGTSEPLEKAEITFWHGMGGNLGTALETLVKNYNASQSLVTVTPQYQGTYDEAINKLRSAQMSHQGPDVMQVYDIGTRYMLDSKSTLPVQSFIDKEKFDTSTLEPNLLAYYTVGGKLNSMPFNSSTPILYYNRSAFRDAGLDASKPPQSLEEILTTALKLLTRDAGGKVSRYGFSMHIYGWFFEQLIIKQGKAYADKGNGRQEPATAVAYDSNGAGLKVMKSWKALVDSGAVANYGRKGADTQNAFIAGNIAMYLDSTAALSGILKGVGDKFEVGTGYFPKVSGGDAGGVSIGGASLWIMDNGAQARSRAAWDFIKYMVAPGQQAFWHVNTGYFPVTTKAYDQQEVKDNLKKYPQFQTAVDQLHASTPQSAGALLGIFPEARLTVETNIENMLGGQITPEQAVENAAKATNAAIAKYNKSVQ